MTASRNVLEEWPPSRWADYLTGHAAGYLEGLVRGRELADAEAAARHRAAADVVLAARDLPVRDAEVDRAAAARRAARWGQC